MSDEQCKPGASAPPSRCAATPGVNTHMRVVFLTRSEWASYYDCLKNALDCPSYDCNDWTLDSVLAFEPTVVVSVHAIPPEIQSTIPQLRERGIWTVQLQDGIVEWRHTYLNARSPAACGRFRPILYDDLIVFGPLWQRTIESLDPVNRDRCHPIGCPRWDPLSTIRHRPNGTSTHRLLVASARTHAFDSRQSTLVRQAFADVAEYLANRKGVETQWRVAPELALELGVPQVDIDSASLPAALSGVDTIITTHSTLMLEAMAMGIPVVLLDYFPYPNFMRAAWEIHSSQSLPDVIESAIARQSEVFQWQQALFSDAVVNLGSASKRVATFLHKGCEHRAYLSRQ